MLSWSFGPWVGVQETEAEGNCTGLCKLGCIHIDVLPMPKRRQCSTCGAQLGHLMLERMTKAAPASSQTGCSNAWFGLKNLTTRRHAYTDVDMQDLKVEGSGKDACHCCTNQDHSCPERSQLADLHACKQSTLSSQQVQDGCIVLIGGVIVCSMEQDKGPGSGVQVGDVSCIVQGKSCTWLAGQFAQNYHLWLMESAEILPPKHKQFSFRF